MELSLHNSLTGKKERFTPIDAQNVRMYVCGPTVYDRPHIGNARAVVVYDVLFRMLQHLYGAEHVRYVRNITDVDDKINAAAKENGEPIEALTERVIAWFHADMAALGNAVPTEEPRATTHIQQMITMIERLIENEKAYVAEKHVLFRVEEAHDYGKLSGKKLEELQAGARVEVEEYKEAPGDFVLWKPVDDEDDPSSVFDSPWGRGRPGWHIECSAMSTEYLGADFDIHGGGADLKFPHHENEIAQSCGAHPGSHYAKYWVHNGFVTVDGEKMAKSAGNFTTVRELLEQGVAGEVIRYVLLKTHYRKPLDFTQQALEEGKHFLDRCYRLWKNVQALEGAVDAEAVQAYEKEEQAFYAALLDDMNTPLAFQHFYALLEGMTKFANENHSQNSDGQDIGEIKERMEQLAGILGIMQQDPDAWFSEGVDDNLAEKVEALIAAREKARAEKNWAEADRIRDELTALGVILEDGPSGTTWRRA